MKICTKEYVLHLKKWEKVVRDQPFKTSAFLRGGGVKNWSNLLTDSCKKLLTERGGGVKNCKKLPTSSMDSPLHIAIEQKALCMICGVIHKLC